MKKKLLAFLCAVSCVFSLCACAESESLTELEEAKLSSCEDLAYYLMQIAVEYSSEATELTSTYNKVEMEYMLENVSYQAFGYAVESDLGAFGGMLTTYAQAEEDMGGLVSTGDCSSKINGDEIVVTYELFGNETDGEFEFVFSNDIFTTLESAEATADLSFKQNLKKAGSSMKNAALNTVLGMGTVFCILILISLIISSFSVIGKTKKKPEEVKTVKVEEPEIVEEELSNDEELVAVIAAAIASFEGETSTDGFVVRSIKKANRRNY